MLPSTCSWSGWPPGAVAKLAGRGIKGIDGGALVASDGGVVVVGSGDPVFYEARLEGKGAEPTRLSRVGTEDSKDNAIVVLAGPHLWMWQAGAMSVLDVRDF